MIDSPRHLANLEVARDLLLSTSVKDGLCIAEFEFGSVILPPEFEPKLRSLAGRECAILRLDGHYHIREVMGSG